MPPPIFSSLWLPCVLSMFSFFLRAFQVISFFRAYSAKRSALTLPNGTAIVKLAAGPLPGRLTLSFPLLTRTASNLPPAYCRTYLPETKRALLPSSSLRYLFRFSRLAQFLRCFQLRFFFQNVLHYFPSAFFPAPPILSSPFLVPSSTSFPNFFGLIGVKVNPPFFFYPRMTSVFSPPFSSQFSSYP